MLEAKNIYKSYSTDDAHYDVLKDVNIKIEKGEIVAIVGKSGSGKSTLMHLLACLDTPSRGTIALDNEDFSLLAEPERDKLRNEKFGFVFQQFFLNGRDTVLENVLLPMRVRGATQYKMIRAAMDALEAVGLKDLEDKPAKNLSGGEKQRVCIARAIVGQPQILFADEPTGNLDSQTGAAVEKILFEMNRQFGITLIIVTHDPELAEKCPRIVELKDGQIIRDTKIENLNQASAAGESDSTEQAAAQPNVAQIDSDFVNETVAAADSTAQTPTVSPARVTGELAPGAAAFTAAEETMSETRAAGEEVREK